MKFVCNNCGFTAEIPVRRTTCPMCGSSNVSSSADTASKFANNIAAEEDDENVKKGRLKPSVGPTQRDTLPDGNNGEKSDSTLEKTAERSEKKTREINRKSKIPLIVALILAAAATVAFFFFFK